MRTWGGSVLGTAVQQLKELHGAGKFPENEVESR